MAAELYVTLTKLIMIALQNNNMQSYTQQQRLITKRGTSINSYYEREDARFHECRVSAVDIKVA